MTTTEGPYADKVVLVTGGSSGVGFQSARRLVLGGAKVVITGRDADRGAAAVRQLEGLSGTAEFTQADSGDPKVLSALTARIASTSGGIDVVVSAGNAGAVGPRPFTEMTSTDVEQEMTTLFYPRVVPVIAAIPHMRAEGSIVLLSTDAGRYPTYGETVVGAYAASIIMMTKSLAKELAPRRIRVNCVSMTLTSDTRSWDQVFGDDDFQRELFTRAASRFPFGRPPTADEVAQAVEFFASGMSSQVTGQTLSVNGGLSFGGW